MAIQHDVQELARVLFEGIEASLKGTTQETLWPSVFRGTLRYENKCRCCGHSSGPTDAFYDLTVPLLDETGTHPISVHGALRKYLATEEIAGFQCDVCDKAVTIERRIVVKALPEVLTLSLMRFMYGDNGTGGYERIKLEHTVEFPFTIDMCDLEPGRSGLNHEVTTTNTTLQSINGDATDNYPGH